MAIFPQKCHLKRNSVVNPWYFRSDGSFVQTEGSAMIFQSELAELNKGLYTCWASFCHHTATVSFQVEVTTRLEQLGTCLPRWAFALRGT